ncbi:MAG: helix-turn-helix transcriptional regulator [Candidatus Peribacter sp.]|nr:helix-turn-helix transcriptional regulator [Candidatus Peribacter sp.]
MKNRIREFRTQKNMTQEALAQAAGVRRETIVFLEQGKYNPSLELAHNVAVALGQTVDSLFLF